MGGSRILGQCVRKMGKGELLILGLGEKVCILLKDACKSEVAMGVDQKLGRGFGRGKGKNW